MKITFLGATRTVTGSAFRVETLQGRVQVDCGLFQGSRSLEQRNRKTALHRPKATDALILTHAHIDHTGLLPALVKAGYQGPVFCTPATRDLCEIMLLDSAHIQEMEAEWQTRRNLRGGRKALRPLYTKDDVTEALKLFQSVPYKERMEVSPGFHVRFQDAGHILGSASVEMWVAEGRQSTKLVFSGDVGRQRQPIIRDPQPIEEAKVLFLESTYGDRLHKTEEDTRQEFLSIINQAVQDGEKVIVPAFAVGRTQEILYLLHAFHRKRQLPKIPVYVDSPLAIAATEIFKKHPECFDEEARALLRQGDEPLDLPQLVLVRSTEDSKAINETKGAAIVIAASGMCNAGRIKHHLKHNLWRPGAHIVFVGYQAHGTTGRKIIDGARKVQIFRESVAVRARIHTLGGFSAHADTEELLAWVENFGDRSLKIFVVHGEEKSSFALAQSLRSRDFSNVWVPNMLESFDLKEPQPVSAQDLVQAPETSSALLDLERNIRKIRKRIARLTVHGGDLEQVLARKIEHMAHTLEEMEAMLQSQSKNAAGAPKGVHHSTIA
jgi:metallo-beta-lactamase family protein